ncbi:MAG: RNA-directed DNA polymerase [Cryomorphaceae bacterium]|jgi:RNA-directed DNA polymerase
MHFKKLASIILRGPLEEDQITLRLAGVLVDNLGLSAFVQILLENFGEGSRPSVWALSEWITAYQDELWHAIVEDEDWDGEGETAIKLSGAPDLLPAKMAPDRFLSSHWRVPSITTLGALAHWLDLPVEHLDWFCGRVRPAELGSKLSHYHVVKISKKSGGTRLLEVPKWQMKQAQRYVLDGILAHIPPHACSHGFQRGRSIVSYVAPHVGQKVIVKFDLKDYFLTADRTRVRSLFHLAGYPPHISEYLAHLCTHGFKDEKLGAHWKYERPHLPQGAPSSPAIADRLLFKLDVRLTGLADKLGMNYSRYADDMAFSSSERLNNGRVDGLKRLVALIVQEEGWWLNDEKTRVMRSGQRQRLAGLVVNTKANLARSEFDRLKVIIFRVKCNGLEAENRMNHPHFLEYLRGRVSFVQMVNPQRAERLSKMLECVADQ